MIKYKSNYNKSAAGFQASSVQPSASMAAPSTVATPQFKPVPNVQSSSLPNISIGSKKVATPKFRAVAPAQSWSPLQDSSPAVGASEALSANLNSPSPPTATAAPMRWTPSKTSTLPPLEIPSSNSLVMDNLNATYNMPTAPTTEGPVVELRQRNNSLPNGPMYNGMHKSLPPSSPRISPPKKSPPPTPTKPKTWFPGMKPDPNQFNAKKQFKTGPPPSPKKTTFGCQDIIAGPAAMSQKFEHGNTPQQYTPVSSNNFVKLKKSFLTLKLFINFCNNP